MEEFVLDAIDRGVDRAYPCAVRDAPAAQLECLDIAAPSTLDGTLDTPVDTDTYSVLTNSSASGPYFGAAQPCDGKVVGDGLISVLDLAVLLLYQFGVAPYDALSSDPSAVATVQGATDVHLRCEVPQSRAAYMIDYAADTCHTMQGRRAEETAPGPRDSVASITTWAAGSSLGIWYRIRPDAMAYAYELLLDGIDEILGDVGLSNALAPVAGDDAPPSDPSRYELRHKRRLEDPRCLRLAPAINAETALYRRTIGIMHLPDVVANVQQDRICEFDLFLWIPTALQTPVAPAIAAGSLALDGRGGAVQQRTSSAVAATPPPTPPPLSPLHPPPAVPRTATSTRGPTWTMGITIVANVISASSLGAIAIALRRPSKTPMR